jgi:protein-tyrosine phosphatase/aminoglycoside phosphotransferase (APT) family kinase protein/nicotinamidase-related amidase
VPLGVLITQCLQQDFVGPLLSGDPVPCVLHVGHREARRLCGDDPERGTLAVFMRWAHEQPAERLRVIHIRDWHDPDDPAQAAHLLRFGNHCLKGTVGGRFVAGINELVYGHPSARIVDAVGLNDFQGTDLPDALEAARRASPDGKLRVGVVGVWTDAKVSFLLYDLATRAGVTELGTCSAFTASVSTQQHQNALEQLGRLLDVRVEHSHGEFASWLTGDARGVPDAPRRTMGAMVDIVLTGDAPPALADARTPDRAVLAHLFRECRRVEMRTLAGGFSGATVLLADSVDGYGHRQAPSVVKLGDRKAIGEERASFERIEAVLGNSAPALVTFADIEGRGGLRYRYASMGAGAVKSFQALYQAGAPQPELDAVLETAVGDILGKLYAAATPEPIDILASYGFSPAWARHVAASVEELAGSSAGDRLSLGGFGEVPNVVRFYDRELGALPRPLGYRYPTSFVHGDLNGQNVLIDGRGNVWIIDFGRVRFTHALCDFAKLENDLLYVMTPIIGAEAAEARAIVDALLAADVAAPLGDPPAGVSSPGLLRAWRTIARLRRIAAPIAEGSDPVGYRAALLRFAAHTMSFSEPTLLQRRWALAAAGILGEQVADDIRRLDRLRIDWVEAPGSGKLGITLCPGRSDRKRNLDADLAALRAGATHLVTLTTDREMAALGVADLPARATALGLEVRRLPMVDGRAPDAALARGLARELAALVRDGAGVVVHCRAGLGRSGTIAAVTLVELGVLPDEAVTSVRLARGPWAVDPGEQELFVRGYSA